jgi:stage V sporulation protein B
MGLIHRIFSGMFWGQAGKILEAALGIIFTVAISRYLGPPGYGIYNLVMSLAGLVIVVSSFGFGEALGKFVPQLLAAGNEAGLSYLLRRLFKTRFVVIISLAFTLIIFREFVSRAFNIPDFEGYMVFVALLAVTQGLSDLLTSFFTALLRIKLLTIARLFIQATILILTIVFFKLRAPAVMIVFLVSAAVSFCGVIVYLSYSRRYLFKIKSEPFPLKPIYIFSATVWLITLATFALANNIDKILIGFLLKDTAQIGHYGIAAMLIVSLHGLLTAGWGVTILPALSEAHAKYGLDGMARVLNVYSKLLLLIMLPAAMFLGLHAHVVIISLFTSVYSPAIYLLQAYILLDAFMIIFIGGVMGFPLYVLGKEKLVLKLCLACGILNIVLDFVLIPTFGALGAVIATGLSGTLFSLAQLIFVFQYVPLKYPYKFLVKVFSAGLACLLPFYYLRIQSIWYLVPAGIIYAVILAAVLYFLRLLEPEDKEVLVKLNPRFAFLVRRNK